MVKTALGAFIGDYRYQLEVPCAKIIDEYDANTTYICMAEVGTPAGDASWRICKIAISGNVTSITWADGNSLYDNIASNRTGLTYI